MAKIPRIVIAGTNSGCGKTTISAGIMSSLSKRGLAVQPFKVGPDYIDPSFHSFFAGRYSKNLDSWMLDEDTVRYLFLKNARSCHIAVIEGVMGMYDGHGTKSILGSTAHMAKILDAPVILIVNGEGMSLSIAALLSGFKDFDKEVPIKGVIINNINSQGYYLLLKEIIEEHTGLTVVGYLPQNENIGLESRHLGLIPAGEIQDLQDRIDVLAQEIAQTIDLDLLIKIAGQAGDLNDPAAKPVILPNHDPVKPRIAVAWDNAFNFYYRDNLDLLEELGVELVFFSPLADAHLPENIHGLYLGGGYPEVFAEDLERNHSMRNDIKDRIEKGLPTYGECGGFMYLSQSIKNGDGKEYQMVGVYSGKSEMTRQLQRFGYIELETVADNVLSVVGQKVRAHEFHYSVTDMQGEGTPCFKITKTKNDTVSASWQCGFKKYNALAGYPHIHFYANPDFAAGFVNSCREYLSETSK